MWYHFATPLQPLVNLSLFARKKQQILPGSLSAAKQLNTRGLSRAVISQMKRTCCPEPGTEGVTAAAEPRQTDQLAAPVDKGARRLGKKHTNTGICRGEIVGYNLHKHQILLVQQ